jgi:transposase-like protein
MERHLKEGRSLAEVARVHGKDPSTMGKLAKRHGLVPSGRARYAAKPIDSAKLTELVDAGATLAEIAARFGVSVSTARKHLKQHDLRTAWSAGLRR